METEPFWSEADVIDAYTREQALEDGFLVDISSLAKEHGFKYPVAITRTAWDKYVEPKNFDILKSYGQDTTGRLWDILTILFSEIKRQHEKTDIINFKVIFIMGVTKKKGVKQVYGKLKAICGPGDTPDPVLTIMLPDED